MQLWMSMGKYLKKLNLNSIWGEGGNNFDLKILQKNIIKLVEKVD